MSEDTMKKLLVTIDTEMDADIHWKKKRPGKYTSIIEGIPKYYRPIWDKYDINPIYFLSPEVVENDDACMVISEEIEKGAMVGAHLHPDFIDPEKTPINAEPIEAFPCYGYEYDIEREKIKNLKLKIERKFGISITWYRAARFGADEDTMTILSDLGFKHDSSYTPCINWKSEGGPDHSNSKVGLNILEPSGIREHPVTILGKRWGVIGKIFPEHWLFYKWLRPTHMTLIEEKSLINEARKKGIDELVMMFHSMEVMVKKTPYVRNRLMQKYFIWRLDKTIDYAIKNGYKSYCFREED